MSNAGILGMRFGCSRDSGINIRRDFIIYGALSLETKAVTVNYS